MELKWLTVLLLLLITVELSSSQQCKEIHDDNRLDCAPDKPNDSQVCSQRKCCYVQHNSTNGMYF